MYHLMFAYSLDFFCCFFDLVIVVNVGVNHLVYALIRVTMGVIFEFETGYFAIPMNVNSFEIKCLKLEPMRTMYNQLLCGNHQDHSSKSQIKREKKACE